MIVPTDEAAMTNGIEYGLVSPPTRAVVETVATAVSVSPYARCAGAGPAPGYQRYPPARGGAIAYSVSRVLLIERSGWAHGRDGSREDIRLQQRDHTDEGRAQHREPEHPTEDRPKGVGAFARVLVAG